jgi:hypothetical protein
MTTRGPFMRVLDGAECGEVLNGLAGGEGVPAGASPQSNKWGLGPSL